MYLSNLKHRLIIFFSLFVFWAKAQVGPPSLRCVSCNTLGDLTLTWVVPSDPGSQFFSYEIFSSASLTGTYANVGSVNTYSINTFTHLGANGNGQSKYYFIKTRYGATGTSTSVASDTLRSIFINLSDPNDGTASLIYNNLHSPKLTTSALNFNIYRMNPSLMWQNIKNTPALSLRDTITVCNVFYNYQVLLTDASGCVSSSNVPGKNFKDLIPPTVAFLDSVSVNTNGESVLGWNPSNSPDCIGYVIYFDNGSTWINIDTVLGINNTNYTSTITANGSSVNHCIASIDSCGNISKLGTDHKTINLKNTYDMCGRKVNLTWNSYSNMPLGVLQYKVYCSVNGGAYVYLGSTASTSYEHKNLEPGKTYCYLVRAYNSPQAITSTSNRSCLIASAPTSSSFVYLHYVTVNSDQSVGVGLFCDTLKACKGFNIYRSEDGITYQMQGFAPFTGKKLLNYTDNDVETSKKNYYYKAEIIDSCGNSRYMSNSGKTILLKVKNDSEKMFVNNLSWDNYYTWQGGVAGYNIYRVVNEQINNSPIDFVPFGINTYSDNIEDIVKESGKVGYFITAIENFGNPYGLIGASSSNISEAYVEGIVFVPNSFAPKGENRIWKPITQFVEKTDYKVSVFNRWGTKVFETTDENYGWDGSGMEDNIYVYIIQYKNARGEFIELKGTITMVR